MVTFLYSQQGFAADSSTVYLGVRTSWGLVFSQGTLCEPVGSEFAVWGHVLCWDSYVMTNISVTEQRWRSGGIVKAGKLATSHLRVTLSVSRPVVWRWDLSLKTPTLQEETGFNGGGLLYSRRPDRDVRYT